VSATTGTGDWVLLSYRLPAVSGPVFDGLYEYHRRRLLLGREPA
jgi:hypothetical protein